MKHTGKPVTICSWDVQAASLSGWEHTEGYPVDVVQEPLHLAHIRAKGPGHISAAAISPDGQLVAFSGAAAGSLRLYRLSRADVRAALLCFQLS